MSFVERVGGILVAPRRTVRRLAAGQARAADIAWLMTAWFVANNVPGIVRCFAIARATDAGSGIEQLVALLSGQLLVDVAAVVLAGLIMSFLLPAHRRHGLPVFDLSAYAWIPYLTVRLGGTLLLTALRQPTTVRAEIASHVVGIVWALAIWGYALSVALEDK